ncbi:hypothetical protein H4S14_000100 [Agrobacterium vitis]|nr:hypothetical protein [Agrobacterium vitis]MBE1436373.1 hypothetical protein [Agrobacterium vitis]
MSQKIIQSRRSETAKTQTVTHVDVLKNKNVINECIFIVATRYFKLSTCQWVQNELYSADSHIWRTKSRYFSLKRFRLKEKITPNA